MVSLFVPGRLCLFGEHSDWAGELRAQDSTIAPGACIIAGTEQGISATAAAATEFRFLSRLPDGSACDPFRAPMELPALRRAAAAADFFSYAAGVAADLHMRFGVGGLHLTVTRTDLPVGRGLSSSAAICVLAARAFNQVYGLGLDTRGEMDAAYAGERAAGSQCGRMDQACAYGRQPVRLGFDGSDLSVEVLRPGQTIHLLIVDLMRQKDTRRILAELRARFLSRDKEESESIRAALGIENLQMIAAARDALENGDALALGRLMSEAQILFDQAVAPACPEELAAPRLHAVLCSAAVGELAWGGKGVGSQGDGAAQMVCRGPEARDTLARHFEAEGMRTLPLTVGAPI